MRLLLAVMLVLSFSQAAWGDTETLRAEANTAASEGNTDEAATKFRELLTVAPDDGAAHYRLGSLLMDNDGDLDEAMAHFERAGELGFQPQGVGYRLSRIYARSGQTEEALTQLETIATAGFGLPNLIEGEADYASLAGNERFAAAVNTIRASRFPCEGDPRFHAFDFWIGEWNVTAGGQQAGTNSITSILGSCLIFEQWTSANGILGKSFNYYDPAHDHWRQIWISDNASIIEFTGQARDGGIFYKAETIDPADGSVTHHKFEFTQNGDGSVRQFWQTSSDGGETWGTIWDGHYEKIK